SCCCSRRARKLSACAARFRSGITRLTPLAYSGNCAEKPWNNDWPAPADAFKWSPASPAPAYRLKTFTFGARASFVKRALMSWFARSCFAIRKSGRSSKAAASAVLSSGTSLGFGSGNSSVASIPAASNSESLIWQSAPSVQQRLIDTYGETADDRGVIQQKLL